MVSSWHLILEYSQQYSHDLDQGMILTEWFPFTRLETRTKESNVYASIRV